MCAHAGGDAARAAVRQLLGEDRLVEVVAALAAVALLVLQPEEAVLGEGAEHGVREPPRRSHSDACGRSSASTKRRTDSRSASCSSPKGGSAAATSAYRPYSGR